MAGRDPGRTGVFVDFDGTLAPIVEDPASARPHDQAVEVLRVLSRRWGRVAVISGRPAAFLVEHLRGSGATRFYGLYGLERSGPDGPVETHPDALRWRRAVDEAAEVAEMTLGASAVERKGLTLTLHYRSIPERRVAVQGLTNDLAARTGLVAHGGKMSVELRPPVGVDKGRVVRELAGGLRAAVFAGDDLGDLPAFAEMAALRGAGVATLTVASGGGETPVEVLEAADVTVNGPEGIMSVLRELAGR